MNWLSLAVAATLLTGITLSCEDEVEYPDHQFLKIHFRYGFKDELDTFQGTYQKDLVIDRTITVDFWLTTEEQHQILAKMIEVGFFQFPDTIRYQPGSDSTAYHMFPSPGTQFPRAEYEGNDKTVIWFSYLPEENDYTPLMLELTSLIIETIKSKPEYQALPPAKGGYI